MHRRVAHQRDTSDDPLKFVTRSHTVAREHQDPITKLLASRPLLAYGASRPTFVTLPPGGPSNGRWTRN